MLAKGIKKVLSATKGPGPKRRRKASSKPLSAKEKQREAESNERFNKFMSEFSRELSPKAQKRKALKALQLEAQGKAKGAKRGVDKKKQAAVKKKIIENKKRIRKKSQKDSYGGIDTLLENLIIPYKGTKDKTVKRMSGGLIKLGKKLVSPKPKPRTRKRKKPVQNIFSDTTGAGRRKFEKGGLPKRKGEAEGARLDPGSSDYRGGVGARTARDVGTKGEKVTIGGLTINNFVRDQASKGARARGKAKAELAKLAREGETLKIRNQAKAAYNKMEAQDIKATDKARKSASETRAKPVKKKRLKAALSGTKVKKEDKRDPVQAFLNDGEIIGNFKPTINQQKQAVSSLKAKRKTAKAREIEAMLELGSKKAARQKNKEQRTSRRGKVLGRKQGGPTNPISTKGSYGGKKKVAKADWMQGLSPAQIQEILGGPTKDASGVVRHSKKKTKKKKKVVKAKKGTGKKTVYDTSGKPITTRKSASPYKTRQTGIPDPAASMRSSVRSQGKKGGGKVLYRSIGGSMLNGNDLIKAIYSPRPDDY